MAALIGLLALAVLLAAIPAAIGAHKERSVLGFFLFGLLCWPIALIVALIIAPLTPAPVGRHPSDLRDLREWRHGNDVASCTACGASTPAGLSFCTSCRQPLPIPS